MKRPNNSEQKMIDLMAGYVSRRVNPVTGQITYYFTENSRLRFVRALLKQQPAQQGQADKDISNIN